MFWTDSGVLVIGESGSLPTTPPMLANEAMRLLLCPLALLASWGPLALLWKNGELPACIFVATNWVLVLMVLLNATLWPNQHFDSWWLGYGLCDLQAYIQFPLTTVYSASMCATMRRLSKQVGLTRVTSLSVREKRQRLLLQLAIIFPVPLLQVAVAIFVQGQRYSIMPVSGCGKSYVGTVIYLVFYVLPSPLFTAAACFHSYQTFFSFRDIAASTRLALNANNSIAASRSQRARRKLYLMTLCVLLPYAPLEIGFCAFNILQGWPWNQPFSLQAVHNVGGIPWNSITLKGYDDASFLEMNMNWISVISAFVVFVFFGTSREAINVYRKHLLRLGLGRVFPCLFRDYNPDRSRVTNASSAGTATGLSGSDTSQSRSRKGSLVPSQSWVSSFLARQSSPPPECPVGPPPPSFPAPTRPVWKPSFRFLHQAQDPIPGHHVRPAITSLPRALDDLELGHGHAAAITPAFPLKQVDFSSAVAVEAPPALNPGLRWFAPPPSLAMLPLHKLPSLSFGRLFFDGLWTTKRRTDSLGTTPNIVLPDRSNSVATDAPLAPMTASSPAVDTPFYSDRLPKLPEHSPPPVCCLQDSGGGRKCHHLRHQYHQIRQHHQQNHGPPRSFSSFSLAPPLPSKDEGMVKPAPVPRCKPKQKDLNTLLVSNWANKGSTPFHGTVGIDEDCPVIAAVQTHVWSGGEVLSIKAPTTISTAGSSAITTGQANSNSIDKDSLTEGVRVELTITSKVT